MCDKAVEASASTALSFLRAVHICRLARALPLILWMLEQKHNNRLTWLRLPL
jgi:hypothetical protein